MNNVKITAEELVEKGIDAYDKGRIIEAIECFDQAIEIEPQLIKAWKFKNRIA